MEGKINSNNRWFIVIVLVVLLMLVAYVGAQMLIEYSKESLTPKSSILRDIDVKDYPILEHELGIVIPKEAKLVGAIEYSGPGGAESKICLTGIIDSETFIKENCFMSIDEKYSKSYYSHFLNKDIEDAVYYKGKNTKIDSRNGDTYSKQVIVFADEDNRYIEMITPPSYDQETMDFFFAKDRQ